MSLFKTISPALIFLLSSLCSSAVPEVDPDSRNVPIAPRAVTEAVAHDSDDPAIWIHPTDPTQSLVIGTDKDHDGALYAFDLKGKTIAKSPSLKRPNNVDIIQNVRLRGKLLDLAVTTEREALRLRFLSVPDLQIMDRGDLVVFDGDATRAPMGIALYQRPRDGTLFAIVGGKSGPPDGYLWVYRVDLDEQGKVTMKKVRSFGNYSGRKEIEAIAVDAELGYVYYSDEKYGIHKYHADPDHPEASKELAVFGTTGFACDIEGIALYRLNKTDGYLIVSNQQADTFRVFPREGSGTCTPHEHPLITSIRLSTQECDGCDASSSALPGFPGGLFVAMSTNRTFQFYAWKDLAAAAGLKSR